MAGKKRYIPKRNQAFNQPVHGRQVNKNVPFAGRQPLTSTTMNTSSYQFDDWMAQKKGPSPYPSTPDPYAAPKKGSLPGGQQAGDRGKRYRSPFNQLKKQVNREWNSTTKKARATKATGRGAVGLTKFFGRMGSGAAKIGAGVYRSTPRPVKFGAAAVGAVAMLGVSMLKGGMNESNDIVYERYMQDAAISKNMLNNTRLGLAAGTSRMQNYGSTMGLSNAMSRTRHGR